VAAHAEDFIVLQIGSGCACAGESSRLVCSSKHVPVVALLSFALRPLVRKLTGFDGAAYIETQP
jgi:hypothetical protein